MAKFTCICQRCKASESFDDLKAAYMGGWNVGRNATCFDCQKEAKVMSREEKLLGDYEGLRGFVTEL